MKAILNIKKVNFSKRSSIAVSKLGKGGKGISNFSLQKISLPNATPEKFQGPFLDVLAHRTSRLQDHFT